MTAYHKLKNILQEELNDLLGKKKLLLHEADPLDVINTLEGLNKTLDTLFQTTEMDPIDQSSYENLNVYWRVLGFFLIKVKEEAVAARIKEKMLALDLEIKAEQKSVDAKEEPRNYYRLKALLQNELIELREPKNLHYIKLLKNMDTMSEEELEREKEVEWHNIHTRLQEIDKGLKELLLDIEARDITEASYERLRTYWEDSVKPGFFAFGESRRAIRMSGAIAAMESGPAKEKPNVAEVKTSPTFFAAAPPVESDPLTVYDKLKVFINRFFTPSSLMPSKSNFVWMKESCGEIFKRKMQKIEESTSDPIERFDRLASYCELPLPPYLSFNMTEVCKEIARLRSQIPYWQLKNVIQAAFKNLIQIATHTGKVAEQESLARYEGFLQSYMVKIEKSDVTKESYDALVNYWRSTGHYLYGSMCAALKVSEEERSIVDNAISDLHAESIVSQPGLR